MRRFFLLLLALLTGACGSSDSFVDTGSSGTASVSIKHTLLRGIPAPVDEIRISGLDSGGRVTFGPVTEAKKTLIELRIPSTVVKLRLEYLDGPKVVAVTDRPVDLTDGVELVEEPEITLLEPYTTLNVTIEATSPNDKGYVRLTEGSGWSTVVRTDLGTQAQDGREARRQALASIAQISDTHVVDCESPLRCEYLRGQPPNQFVSAQDLQGSFRAQETMTTHVVEAMIRQLNDIARGPISGRAFDCMISTGDNGDNRQTNELNWFITLLDGGTINPSSGNPALYEGVQDTAGGNPRADFYYHPSKGVDDIYKRIYGFPDYDGLLDNVVKPFTAEGSRTPWYTVYGNHDNLIMGNLPTRSATAPAGALDGIVTGTQKNTDLPAFYQGNILGFFTDFFNLFGFWNQFIARGDVFRMTSGATAHRTVTADSTRRLIDPTGWAQAHFSGKSTPGPVGHGLQADSPTTGNLYYTFQVAQGVTGITLDTVNRAGYADGSLDQAQFQWLEQQLIANSSKYYDTNGTLVTSANPDRLIVAFSHHNSFTMNIVLTDADNPAPRFKGSDLIALFKRFPNMVLWVNGHSHFCKVAAHPDPKGGFWEINTPSHIDYPQQSRIVEVLDNQDGTLSFFGTLVDHQAPPETDPTVQDVLGLAAISRELSANDNLLPRAGQLNTPGDRNVELLIKKPF